MNFFSRLLQRFSGSERGTDISNINPSAGAEPSSNIDPNLPVSAPKLVADATKVETAVFPVLSIPFYKEVVEEQLAVRVFPHFITSEGKEVACWTYITDGLRSYQQKEIALTLLSKTGQAKADFPRDPFELFHRLFGLVVLGQILDAGDYLRFQFPGGFLGRKEILGVVFIEAESFPLVAYPEKPLAIILTTANEASLLPELGTFRLLGRLGLQNRYFPTVVWNDPDREDVLSATEFAESILPLLPRVYLSHAEAVLCPVATTQVIPPPSLKGIARMTAKKIPEEKPVEASSVTSEMVKGELQFASAVFSRPNSANNGEAEISPKQAPTNSENSSQTREDFRNHTLYLTIPEQQRRILFWQLYGTELQQPFAVLTRFSARADAVMVCAAKSRKSLIVTPHNMSPERQNGGFVAFVLSEQQREGVQLIEDGYICWLMPTTFAELRTAIEEGNDFSLPSSGFDRDGLVLNWQLGARRSVVFELVQKQPCYSDEILKQRLVHPAQYEEFLLRIQRQISRFVEMLPPLHTSRILLVAALRMGHESHFWFQMIGDRTLDDLKSVLLALLKQIPAPEVKSDFVAHGFEFKVWSVKGEKLSPKNHLLPEEWLTMKRNCGLAEPQAMDHVLQANWPKENA